MATVPLPRGKVAWRAFRALTQQDMFLQPSRHFIGSLAMCSRFRYRDFP